MAQVLKDEVRDRIIKAATNEFYKNGFSKGTLRNISKLAGITTGNVYRYFNNKNAIYEEVVSDTFYKISKILEEETDNKFKMGVNPTFQDIEDAKNNNPREKVRKVILKVVKEFGDNRMSLLILLRDNRENSKIDMKYNLQNWFKAHFDILYKDLDISMYLAESFVEGLIDLLLREKDELAKKTETFVNFFFMRKVEDCE